MSEKTRKVSKLPERCEAMMKALRRILIALESVEDTGMAMQILDLAKADMFKRGMDSLESRASQVGNGKPPPHAAEESYGQLSPLVTMETLAVPQATVETRVASTGMPVTTMSPLPGQDMITHKIVSTAGLHIGEGAPPVPQPPLATEESSPKRRKRQAETPAKWLPAPVESPLYTSETVPCGEPLP